MTNLLATFFRPAATALVSLACFTLAEATAQTNERVRVSIKRILGPSGVANSFWTDSNIEQWMRDSNQVFNRDLGIQLILSEVVDVPDPGAITGGASWWAVSPERSHLANLEDLAQADPTLYGWRSNAINIYLVNEIFGLGGVCSFPDGQHAEILFVQPNILNGSIGFCHALGHYFDLMHTHEDAHGVENWWTSCQYPSSNWNTAGDLVSDTPGDPYLSQPALTSLASRVALLNSIYGSGSCFGANSAPFRRLRYNVMSYYSEITTADALFTAGQRTRVQAALTNHRQHVVIPMSNPNYPLAISGYAGLQGTPYLQLSPPRLGSYLQIGVERAPSLSPTYLVLGLTRADLPMPLGAVLNPSPDLVIPKVTDSDGATSAPFYLPNMPSLVGLPLYMQSLSLDLASSGAVVMSDTRRGELFQRMESDFDGDGYADLAVGAHGETVNGAASAGAVSVVYGGHAGLAGTGSQMWHQDQPGIYGACETSDRFGQAMAYGDFNGDDYADLAISSPGEGLGGALNTGGVHVLFGGPAGLSGAGSQFLHQGLAGLQAANEDFDDFGFALAAGDINGDGFADLAIGIPGEDIGSIGDAGAVAVLFGGAAGLTTTGSQVFHQDVAGLGGRAEADDRFGTALLVDDFDSDGFAELVVGIPGEDIGSKVDAGGVHLLRGSSAGLTVFGDRLWHQDEAGVLGTAEAGDRFGYVLESGDFNSDGFPDLAVGAPSKLVRGVGSAGIVQVFPGGWGGLTNVGSEIWSQGSVGVYGAVEAGDNFGSALAAGDFDGDGFADLAVGSPGEAIGTVIDSGMVNILQGGCCGLSGGEGSYWYQGARGLAGTPERPDQFGKALAAADLNRDGCADLMIGVPYEGLENFGVTTLPYTGLVQVLFGEYGVPGLTATGNQVIQQGSGGLAGVPEAYDHFGGSVAR